MKLIVGLGNPGKEYENTRHNIGFMIVDNFVKNNNLESFKEKFNGLYSKNTINGEQVIFLKPLSYMNLSGTVVRKFVDYFKIDINDILVIQDDLDMPVGKIKLKQNSSSGGHNGIKNISLELHTENYKRFKVGISNNKFIDTKDYVLGNFNKEEKQILDKIINVSENIINDYFNTSFEKIMSKYNGVYDELSK